MDIKTESRLLRAVEKYADSLDIEDLIMYFVDSEMAYYEKYAPESDIYEFIENMLGEED